MARTSGQGTGEQAGVDPQVPTVGFRATHGGDEDQDEGEEAGHVEPVERHLAEADGHGRVDPLVGLGEAEDLPGRQEDQ